MRNEWLSKKGLVTKYNQISQNIHTTAHRPITSSKAHDHDMICICMLLKLRGKSSLKFWSLSSDLVLRGESFLVIGKKLINVLGHKKGEVNRY